MTRAFDLVISGAEVVLPGSSRRHCEIAIRDGRIAAIMEPGESGDNSSTFDASGLVILPGAIDAHIHLGHQNDISRPRVANDAKQESAAAVKGGVTCFISYLMAGEPFEQILPEVIAVTEAGSRVDFGFHPIISTEAQLAGVPRYAEEFGAPTFKIFMNNRGGEGARLGLPDIDDGFLLRLCEAAAAYGGMVCPHPETIELAWVLRDRVKAADPEGRGGLATWNATRPPFVEADAVQHAAYVAHIAGAPLYVVHTSSAEALEAGLRQRRAGAVIHIETCPHYLTHDVSWAGGATGKINPPLREASDREALWRGLLNGDIDTVATDHVHRSLGSKQGSIWEASPGCPGLETLVPVLLSEGHHKRSLSLERIADLISTNPARLMGLHHRKGSVTVGLDADLMFVDLDAVWTLSRGDIASGAGYSIYEDWKFKGRVVHTMQRGSFTMRDLHLQDNAVGSGRYISRRLPRRTAG